MDKPRYSILENSYNQSLLSIGEKALRSSLRRQAVAHLSDYPFWTELTQNLPKILWLKELCQGLFMAVPKEQKDFLSDLYAPCFWAPEEQGTLRHRLDQVSLVLKEGGARGDDISPTILPLVRDYCDHVAERQNHLAETLHLYAAQKENFPIDSFLRTMAYASFQEVIPSLNQVDICFSHANSLKLSGKEIQSLSLLKNCIMGEAYSDKSRLKFLCQSSHQVPCSFRISEFRHKRALSLTQRI